jgi:hypothetical protein
LTVFGRKFGDELARRCFRGVDLAEIANVPTTTLLRDRAETSRNKRDMSGIVKNQSCQGSARSRWRVGSRVALVSFERHRSGSIDRSTARPWSVSAIRPPASVIFTAV